jgi:serine/threonine-protein kinase
MSPEQARAQTLDARSDLFSLGAVLYELVSGRRAFRGQTMLDVLSAVIGAEPEPLDSGLWPIVERCLAKDPAQRFPSAAGLRAALEGRSSAPLTLATAGPTATVAVPAPVKPSIAVLPFANMSGDREQEYFSDGLAEEIINALVKTSGLKVIARTSAFAFKGQNADVRKIAETLGVGHVLEGSVRRSGNRLRVTAQLIAAADGSHLWSERYDREMADVFDIQDELSSAIAGVLQEKLSASVDLRPAEARRRTPKPAAYEALLKAWHYSQKHTAQAVALAGELFEQAIALDTEFALAHSSYAGYLLGRAHMGLASAHELMPMVRAEAAAALDLDPSLGDARAVLAIVAGIYDYDWAAADRHFAEAKRAGGISPWTRALCAVLYLRLAGRMEEALREGELAVQEDPLNPGIRVGCGMSLMSLGRLRDAEAQFRQVFEMAPDFPPALASLSMLYASEGRLDEAQAGMEKAYALTPWAIYTIGPLSGMLARRGERARAAELVADIRSRPAYVMNTGMMHFYMYTGDVEQLARWMEKVIEDRYVALAMALRSPVTAPLRTSQHWPRLAALLNL